MSSEGASIQSFRDLLTWQKAMNMVEKVYDLTSTMPAQERYGLVSQMRRAAVSIPSNIAEGHAREATKEFTRYLSIARGSLAELETQLEIALRLRFVTHDHVGPILAQCDELGRMLRGLRKSLDRKLAAVQP